MGILENDNLFQLEIIQENIKLLERCDRCIPPSDVFLTFSFMQNGPFSMLEPDPCQEMETKLGKSVVFSLTPQRIQAFRTTFSVCFHLYHNLQDGGPSKCLLGSGETCLIDLYNELLQSVSYKEPPCTKSLRDCVDMLHERKKTGVISIFIRLSCYGKFVVTTLSLNADGAKQQQGEGSKSKKKSKKTAKKVKRKQSFLDDSDIKCPKIGRSKERTKSKSPKKKTAQSQTCITDYNCGQSVNCVKFSYRTFQDPNGCRECALKRLASKEEASRGDSSDELEMSP